jgi:hypothetical protein
MHDRLSILGRGVSMHSYMFVSGRSQWSEAPSTQCAFPAMRTMRQCRQKTSGFGRDALWMMRYSHPLHLVTKVVHYHRSACIPHACLEPVRV